MAVSLLVREISDLCLGKPALRSLPVSATVADALAALKTSDDGFVSIWRCHHNKSKINTRFGDDDDEESCECVGKVCMVDVICYICKDEKNLSSPSAALKAPVSVLLPRVSGTVVHVQPSCSLLEAMDLMLQGVQNLVVPIQTKVIAKRRQVMKAKSSPSLLTTTHKYGQEFCWITQEDIIRFILSSIALFSPISSFSLQDLGLITTASHTINYYFPASAALPAIAQASAEQTAVAVVDPKEDEDGAILIGEISPYTLACHDEAVAAAVATLSAGDLMAYIDCVGPPEKILWVVKTRLEEKGLVGMVHHLDESLYYSSTSCSSSDEESTVKRSGARSKNCSARMVRRAEAIVCSRKSSLVAVMIQAIAHRVNYVWVVEEDCSLSGIVTFVDMLRIFRDHLKTTR